MNERVHRALDGDLPVEELSPDERRELESLREAILAGTKPIRKIVAPDLTGAIMSRISGLEPARLDPARTRRPSTADPGAARRLWSWFWSPRPVPLRPAYAVLSALAAVALGVFITSGGPAPSAIPTVATVGPSQVFVQFRLDAPDATSVRLAGSFTGWQAEYTLEESEPGVWSILIPLSPGVHDYSFVVDDGEWRPDPMAPSVSDGFGGENSRLAIVLPDLRS